MRNLEEMFTPEYEVKQNRDGDVTLLLKDSTGDDYEAFFMSGQEFSDEVEIYGGIPRRWKDSDIYEFALKSGQIDTDKDFYRLYVVDGPQAKSERVYCFFSYIDAEDYAEQFERYFSKDPGNDDWDLGIYEVDYSTGKEKFVWDWES